jgi:enamine deaminase RidA (YjgF/YER057c/UK114 family)
VNHQLTPDHLGAPSANYALATLADGPQKLLNTSGIGPVRPDGSVPDDPAEQATVIWSTLSALLDEAEMAVDDIVSVTTYVVTPPDGEELGPLLGEVMAARDAALSGHLCASILVPVPALATPTWKLEIAVVAAR